MIVEFIGSTGAGKTTLISKVRRRLSKSMAVTTPFDLITAPLRLRVTHTTARNVIQELTGLPFFIRSLPRYKAFVAFAVKMLARQKNVSFLTICNLRSIERKLGMYEIIRHYKRERIVLVDEGTVLAAHNMFVFTDVLYTPGEIARFADLVPLPDFIVYVRASTDNLIKRSLERTDRRRELEFKNRAVIEKYLNRATDMFEQLIENEKIRSRLLVVDNPDSSIKDYETNVEYISDFLLNHKTSGNYVTAQL